MSAGAHVALFPFSSGMYDMVLVCMVEQEHSCDADPKTQTVPPLHQVHGVKSMISWVKSSVDIVNPLHS